MLQLRKSSSTDWVVGLCFNYINSEEPMWAYSWSTRGTRVFLSENSYKRKIRRFYLLHYRCFGLSQCKCFLRCRSFQTSLGIRFRILDGFYRTVRIFENFPAH